MTHGMVKQKEKKNKEDGVEKNERTDEKYEHNFIENRQ